MQIMVNEIFRSIQGEGLLIGQPSVFIRLALCNVNCPMCDTDYQQGVRVDVDELVKAVKGSYARGNIKHVVVTGGEPYIHAALPFLLEQFGDWHVTVETSGTIRPDSLSSVDLLSVSPKFCSLRAGTKLPLITMLESFYSILDMMPRHDIQTKLVWNGDMVDIPEFLPGVIQRLEASHIPVFFQPMTDGPEFDLIPYLDRLNVVTKAVQDAFGSWPRVLPQLHKLMRLR